MEKDMENKMGPGLIQGLYRNGNGAKIVVLHSFYSRGIVHLT